MKLDVIDYQAPGADAAFVESLHDTGFAVLRRHPLPQVLVDGIYQHWQAFFDSDTKQAYRFSERFDGFFPLEVSETAKGHSLKDIKEYYHYYPWGQCPPDLREALQSYYQAAGDLAAELLTWVERHSPQAVKARYSQPLSQMIEGSEQTLLRVLHYPPFHGGEVQGAVRAAAHEDINLLTLLPAANEPGLQVKSLKGEWLDVPCDFGNLIVNIGDMLKEASGGYFPSTTHQVINPVGADVNRSRISLPLFLHPRADVVLSECYTADSYLRERLRELGFAV